MDYVIQNWFWALLKIPGMKKLMGVTDVGPGDWKTIWKERQEQGLEFGNSNLDEINGSANKLWADGTQKATHAWNEFIGRMATLNGNLPRVLSDQKNDKGQGEKLLTQGKRIEATNLEKMGFIFNGSTVNVTNNYARQTAQNTQRTSKLMEDFIRRVNLTGADPKVLIA